MLRSRLPIIGSLPAFLTLLLGLATTAVLVTSVYRLEQETAEIDFRQRAGIRLATIRQGMSDAVTGLEILNQLFVTASPITRQQFHQFTQPLLQRYPYIQAFNYHR